MERASHLVSQDFSLGQGSLLVRTHVVDGEEIAIDVEYGDLFALHIDQARLPGIDLVGFCNLHKVGHFLASFPTCYGPHQSVSAPRATECIAPLAACERPLFVTPV